MPTSASKQTTVRCPVPGATITADRAGSGPAVVLIHAGICDRTMWDEPFAALSNRFDVIRYDIRGMGDSTPDPGADDTPFSHHGDLLALLDHFGVGRAALVGCSFGAGIALDTALAAPDRVSALVLVSARPAGFPWDPATIAEIQRLDELLEAGDIEAANAGEIRLWVVGPGRSPDAVDRAIRDRVSAMNLAALRSEWDGAGLQPLDPPAGTRLGEISVPTLIVVGDHDVPCFVSAADGLARGIPGSSLVHFAEAAHLPSMEDPARFITETTRFLEQAAHPPEQT